jgi:glycosyltransferase involved in cell wall biosynthesis
MRIDFYAVFSTTQGANYLAAGSLRNVAPVPMKICFIADSSSIHAQRIISYYVGKEDEVLVLSSARLISNIPGTRTEHLLVKSTRSAATAVRTRIKTSHLIARLKSFVPRALIVESKRVLRALRLLRKRKFCIKEIRRFDPDVIYSFRSFPEGMLASHCHVRPLLLRTAGPDISKLPKYPFYRQAVRRALESADVVVTESLWEQRLLRHLCSPRVVPKVGLIGINTSLFKPPVSRDSLRAKYSLPPDSFVVVSNRYLDGHYHGWMVVDAVRSILKDCSGLILLYVNPSKMSTRTRAKAEAIATQSQQVRFIDGPLPQSEMPEILGCGDIYVSLSSADGIPNSLLEAMACGIVPIAGDLPQLREWIDDSKNGYLVPSTDTVSLASIIRHLYVNRQPLFDMSKKCVSKIRQEACFEECSKRTRTLLFELAKKDGKQTVNGRRMELELK